jgi:GntR family transcriptional regulator
MCTVVKLQRIRLADATPLVLETAYLNPVYCPNLLKDHDFSVDSMYRVLHEVYMIDLMWANQWIEARLPDVYERRHLNIKQHDPVLSLTRVTFNENGIPLELVRSVYIGRSCQLCTTLQMGDSNT